MPIRSRGAAYAALVALTLVWSANWLVMKAALLGADPVAFNIQRVILAIVVLFALLVVQGRPLAPPPLIAIAVTGFFQTTLNFGSTTMAVATGGAGRTSVLVFIMPFWTVLLAWPVLGERVRGSKWIAMALALAGLTVVVEPWNWRQDLAPKLWAVLSGFGWAAGTVAAKYFQRGRKLDMLNFVAWQMLVGMVPFLFVPLVRPTPFPSWSVGYVAALVFVGAIATGGGFVMWNGVLRWLPAGTAALNMLAIPALALVGSMLLFGERLNASEWIGIALIALGLVQISVRSWLDTRRGAAEPPAPVTESG